MTLFRLSRTIVTVLFSIVYVTEFRDICPYFVCLQQHTTLQKQIIERKMG